MPFLNKSENSISDSNIENSYKVQYEKLKQQLNQANETNNKNIIEIKELKTLLNNYSSQLDNIKISYNDTIEDLRAQLKFEKEINEKYLSKLIETNNNLNKSFNELNYKNYTNNKELMSLIKSNDNTNNTEEINKIKELISDNNKEILEVISQMKKETKNEMKEIKEGLNNQNEDITKINSFNEKFVGMEEKLNNNFNEITTLIHENKENHSNNTSEIIKQINDSNNNSEEFNKIKELINTNKQHLIDFSSDNKETQNNIKDSIIEELSNSDSSVMPEDILYKIDESIQLHDKLLENASNEDTIKSEIFNKISSELKNEDYTNIEAYKKIKDYGLFDETFYKDSYNYELDIDPLLHYIYIGYEENKKPNANFDNSYYKSTSKKIEESTLNPLVYFVTEGLKEGNIKINENIEDLTTINKNDIDNEFENFSIRGVKKTKRKPRIIVCLTTSPKHIDEVHYTLYSLLNQEVKPDKVVLWLKSADYPNGEYELPKEVLKLKNNGLSIKFNDDFKSYNGVLPTLVTYPNDIIVTAEENMFYPSNWLKILFEEYRKNDDFIIAHDLYKINIDDNGNITQYESWSKVEDETASKLNFANLASGVLYPPHSFNDDVLNEDMLIDLCEDSNDLWLWAMSVLNDKQTKCPKNNLNSLIYVNPARQLNLIDSDKKNIDKDTQLNNLLNKYPKVIDIIKDE